MFELSFSVPTIYDTGSVTITAKGGDCVDVRFYFKDHGEGFTHVVDGRALAEGLLFAINSAGNSPSSENFRKRALHPPTAPRCKG